MTFTRITYTI